MALRGELWRRFQVITPTPLTVSPVNLVMHTTQPLSLVTILPAAHGNPNSLITRMLAIVNNLHDLSQDCIAMLLSVKRRMPKITDKLPVEMERRDLRNRSAGLERRLSERNVRSRVR
jgi:hypothetical protein